MIWPLFRTLGARAEICQIILLIKNLFWNCMTFSLDIFSFLSFVTTNYLLISLIEIASEENILHLFSCYNKAGHYMSLDRLLGRILELRLDSKFKPWLGLGYWNVLKRLIWTNVKDRLRWNKSMYYFYFWPFFSEPHSFFKDELCHTAYLKS